MKVIKIEGCYKPILPEDAITIMSDGSGTEKLWCPYLFRHQPVPIYGSIDSKQYDGKYMYCKLINAKFKAYKGYGDMKKMFTECPLEDTPDTESLISTVQGGCMMVDKASSCDNLGCIVGYIPHFNGSTIHFVRDKKGVRNKGMNDIGLRKFLHCPDCGKITKWELPTI